MAEGRVVLRVLGVVAKGVEVNRDAGGGTIGVLAAIAPSHGARLVIEERRMAFEFSLDFEADPDLLLILFQEREDRGLDWSNPRMESHHDAGIGLAFGVGDILLVVGFTDESEHCAAATGGWFHNTLNELLPCRLI